MRKVIQISNSVAPENEWHDDYSVTSALCDDGSIFEHRSDVGTWKQLPPIPQPEIADEVVMPNVGDAIFVGVSEHDNYDECSATKFISFEDGYVSAIHEDEEGVFTSGLWKCWKFNINDQWRDATGKIVEV